MSEPKTSVKGTVVRQASFLMIAQMTSSVIGLIYRSPLHMIMGDIGDGYYQFAYEWYTIILLIASYSIPSAVSKVMAERLAVGSYKNAHKVFKAALMYVCVVGLAGGLLAFFGAPFFLANEPGAILALRVLAPTIFLSGILGVMRGFFQAHNSMKQTAVSQIAEQLLNAFFSVLMAFLFSRPFVGNENLTGEYAAAGGTFGTGAGVVTGLLVMMFFFMKYRPDMKRNIASDTKKREESYGQVFKVILMMVTPIILATCVYNVSSVVDQVIFTNLMTKSGESAEQISSVYGLFGYRVKPIINIPIALASATSTALIPAVASSIAEKNIKEARAKIDECVKLTLFIAIPSSFGVCILSWPVMRVLYPTGNVKAAAVLLSCGAISVVFYSLSTVTNGVLQGMGHPSIPVRNAAIGLVVNVATVYITVRFLRMSVMGILLATVLYSMTVMALNASAVEKHLRYRTRVRQLIPPIKASLVMSVFVAAIYWGPTLLFPSVFDRYLMSAVLMAISVLAGILVYFIFYPRFAGLTDREIRQIPMGTRMLGLLKKLHLR